MANENARLYLYLARRDRTDVRVLAILNGSPKTGRVESVSSLNLEPELAASVHQAIHENRMYWEAWIEPADTYRSLRDKLIQRGYRNLPFNCDPIVPSSAGKNHANTSSLPGKSSMMRKPR